MIDKKVFSVDMLPAIKQFTGDDVAELRNKLGVSQSVLALIFGVADATVKSWERKGAGIALKGGDLIIANQLMRLGLHGYLHGTGTGSDDKVLKEAAYEVLSDAKEQRAGVLVKQEAIESLRAALGLRTEKRDAAIVIRQAKAKAVGAFASKVGELVANSSTVEEIEEGLKALMTDAAVEA